MSKVKGFCEICGDDIEITLCCSSFDCGCRGLPTEPPICSEKCYDKYMEPKEPKEVKPKVNLRPTDRNITITLSGYNNRGLKVTVESKLNPVFIVGDLNLVLNEYINETIGKLIKEIDSSNE